MLLDFKQNLSLTDRVVRIIIGFILLSLGLTHTLSAGWAVLAVVLALSQFIEGALGY